MIKNKTITSNFEESSSKESSLEEFNFSDLFISWLIGAIIIISAMLLKSNYDFKLQQVETIKAMKVAIEVNEKYKKSDKQNNELVTIINLQKEMYKNELDKYKKYDKIIKDIDRTWNKPK